jgi:hypothetical protein
MDKCYEIELVLSDTLVGDDKGQKIPILSYKEYIPFADLINLFCSERDLTIIKRVYKRLFPLGYCRPLDAHDNYCTEIKIGTLPIIYPRDPIDSRTLAEVIEAIKTTTETKLDYVVNIMRLMTGTLPPHYQKKIPNLLDFDLPLYRRVSRSSYEMVNVDKEYGRFLNFHVKIDELLDYLRRLEISHGIKVRIPFFETDKKENQQIVPVSESTQGQNSKSLLCDCYIRLHRKGIQFKDYKKLLNHSDIAQIIEQRNLSTRIAQRYLSHIVKENEPHICKSGRKRKN